MSCWGAFPSEGRISYDACTKKCAEKKGCQAIEWQDGGQGCELVMNDQCDRKMSAYAHYDVKKKVRRCSNFFKNEIQSPPASPLCELIYRGLCAKSWVGDFTVFQIARQ